MMNHEEMNEKFLELVNGGISQEEKDYWMGRWDRLNYKYDHGMISQEGYEFERRMIMEHLNKPGMSL